VLKNFLTAEYHPAVPLRREFGFQYTLRLLRVACLCVCCSAVIYFFFLASDYYLKKAVYNDMIALLQDNIKARHFSAQ